MNKAGKWGKINDNNLMIVKIKVTKYVSFVAHACVIRHIWPATSCNRPNYRPIYSDYRARPRTNTKESENKEEHLAPTRIGGRLSIKGQS